MTDTVDKALKYALQIEGMEHLSPNEKHIIELAKEVQRLRLLFKRHCPAIKVDRP